MLYFFAFGRDTKLPEGPLPRWSHRVAAGAWTKSKTPALAPHARVNARSGGSGLSDPRHRVGLMPHARAVVLGGPSASRE